MSSAGELALLFYDGFERWAEDRPLRWIVGQARRPARYWWRRLQRKQIWTGRYVTFRALVRALRRTGHDVRINDFAAARRRPDYPIAVSGYTTTVEKVERLPNPRLLGSGLYDSPLQRPNLFDDQRNRLYVQRSEWEQKLFAPYWGDKLRLWYRGYDVADFEDAKLHPKSVDVLIYDKIYHDRERFHEATIVPFTKILDAANLSYEIIRYGAYFNADYINALKRCRSMAFFAHSEVQGNAQVEASAMNVPIFAWDEGIWLDRLAKELSDQPIACSSVTHFDERCGVRFKIENLAERWETFWSALDRFEPRQYVREQLSLEGSAALYMKHYRETGALSPRSAQQP